MEKRIGLMFDCLRAPYDAAHIIQVALALDNCDLYLSGDSIDFNNKKIKSKIESWGLRSPRSLESFTTYDQAINKLRGRGKYLIGTSPHATKSLYDLDLREGNQVFVFGNESSGLSRSKILKLDEMVSVPMLGDMEFLTLPVVVPVVAYEYYRQLRYGR